MSVLQREIREAQILGRVLNVLEEAPLDKPFAEASVDLNMIADLVNGDGGPRLGRQALSVALANSKIFYVMLRPFKVRGFQVKPGVKRPVNSILKHMQKTLAVWHELNAELPEEQRHTLVFSQPAIVD
jgi:hypothetical protein